MHPTGTTCEAGSKDIQLEVGKLCLSDAQLQELNDITPPKSCFVNIDGTKASPALVQRGKLPGKKVRGMK